jgi:transcriptional regulator with XRE-family HTH domain
LAVRMSFTGDIANPITDARLEQSFSGPALAKRLGLSRQYLNRAEQGTYTSLNPSLKRWVSNALNISPESVHQRYVQFQKAQRRATTERVDPVKLERRSGDNEPGYIIFERWRNGYWTSPTQFSIAFCVHPDAVQKYEEGIQKRMPEQIRNALEESKLLDPGWSDHPTGASLSA